MIRPSVRIAMTRLLFALLVGFALSSAAVSAQQVPAPQAAPAATDAAALPLPKPAPGFVQPKTPWGDPDIQGFWPGVEMVGVPLQRPARFGTRNVLTEEEFTKRASELQNEEESLLALEEKAAGGRQGLVAGKGQQSHRSGL